jgi:hypothetical protein
MRTVPVPVLVCTMDAVYLALVVCLEVVVQLLIQALDVLQAADAVQPRLGHLLAARSPVRQDKIGQEKAQDAQAWGHEDSIHGGVTEAKNRCVQEQLRMGWVGWVGWGVPGCRVWLLGR